MSIVTGPRLYHSTRGGRFIIEARRSRRGGSSKQPDPWDVTLSAVGDPPTSYTAKFWPGLIAGMLPSNMFSTFNVPASGTHYLTATCSSDGRAVSSSILSIESSAPVFPAPKIEVADSEVQFPIGIFVDNVYFNLWKKNITVTTREVLREDKSDPGPLELPYTSWWGWQVS